MSDEQHKMSAPDQAKRRRLAPQSVLSYRNDQLAGLRYGSHPTCRLMRRQMTWLRFTSTSGLGFNPLAGSRAVN